MSAFKETLQAFNGSLKTLAVANSWPAGYPGDDIADDDKGEGIWVQGNILPGQSTPVTVGNYGEDDNPGIYQIDINRPVKNLLKEQMEAVDIIAEYFTAGKIITYNTTKVRIRSSSLSPGRYVGGYYRVSVSVLYYVRTNRTL